MPAALLGQPRDIAGIRPKTPDGPRNNLESSQAGQLGPRSSNHRDIHQTRQQRYDPNRPMNTSIVRPSTGFRAPPPTGPRASAMSGMAVNTQGANALRPPHIGRAIGMNDPIRGTSTSSAKSSPPSNDRAEQSTSSSAPPTLSINPERSSMLRHGSRDEQNETSKVQRPSTTIEPRLSRSRTTQSELSNSAPQRDPAHTAEAPRGPSDWRGRPKRDLQDDDPRRLSRGLDSWADGGEESDRPARPVGAALRPRDHVQHRHRIIDGEREHRHTIQSAAGGHAPAHDTMPRLGLSPTTSPNAAGTRPDPAVSVPSASGVKPAATASAEPVLEPPAMSLSSNRLRAMP